MPRKGDNLDYSTARMSLEHHGLSGVYKTDSVRKEDLFIIDRGVELLSDGYESQLSTLTTIIQYDATLMTAKRGGRFTIGCEIFVIDAVLKNDGFLGQVSVVKS